MPAENYAQPIDTSAVAGNSATKEQGIAEAEQGIPHGYQGGIATLQANSFRYCEQANCYIIYEEGAHYKRGEDQPCPNWAGSAPRVLRDAPCGRSSA
jgi:hypothetical protein